MSQTQPYKEIAADLAGESSPATEPTPVVEEPVVEPAIEGEPATPEPEEPVKEAKPAEDEDPVPDYNPPAHGDIQPFSFSSKVTAEAIANADDGDTVIVNGFNELSEVVTDIGQSIQVLSQFVSNLLAESQRSNYAKAVNVIGEASGIIENAIGKKLSRAEIAETVKTFGASFIQKNGFNPESVARVVIAANSDLKSSKKVEEAAPSAEPKAPPTLTKSSSPAASVPRNDLERIKAELTE